MFHVEIRAVRPSAEEVRLERRQTLRSLGILFLLGAATTLLVLSERIPVVVRLPAVGSFAAEVAITVLLFDAYFYGLHRLLHTRWLFRRVHAVHHRARERGAWSAIAMHPIELSLLAGFLPAMMWLRPMHLASIVTVGVFLGVSIALAHTGREVLPRWWARVPGLSLYLTPTVHALHHARLSCNFGATVTIFDRIFGTLRSA